MKTLRRFFCWVGWHAPTKTMELLGFDNAASACKGCGKRILWSSGGWFAP